MENKRRCILPPQTKGTEILLLWWSVDFFQKFPQSLSWFCKRTYSPRRLVCHITKADKRTKTNRKAKRTKALVLNLGCVLFIFIKSVKSRFWRSYIGAERNATPKVMAMEVNVTRCEILGPHNNYYVTEDIGASKGPGLWFFFLAFFNDSSK